MSSMAGCCVTRTRRDSALLADVVASEALAGHDGTRPGRPLLAVSLTAVRSRALSLLAVGGSRSCPGSGLAVSGGRSRCVAGDRSGLAVAGCRSRTGSVLAVAGARSGSALGSGSRAGAIADPLARAPRSCEAGAAVARARAPARSPSA